MPCSSLFVTRLTSCTRRPLPRMLAAGFALLAALPAVADTQPPVPFIYAPDKSITNSGPVEFWVSYSDNLAVQEITLTESDVTLHTTGTVAADVSVEVYGLTAAMVTLSNITGDGELALSLAPGTAADDAGNPAIAAGPSEVVAIDNTPPAGALGTPSTLLLGMAQTEFILPFSYSDASALFPGFVDAEYHTTGSVNIFKSINEWDGSYRNGNLIRGVGYGGSGELALTLPAGFVVDAAGNVSLPVGPSPTVVVDFASPVISDLTVEPALARAGTTITISFTSSEPLVLEGSFATAVRVGHKSAFGEPATFETTAPLNRYTYSYVVGQFDFRGLNSVTVQPVDLMWNSVQAVAEDVVEFDTQPPYFMDFTATPYIAGLGQEVLITFSCYNDDIATLPVVITDGEEASFVSKEGVIYTYSYTVKPNSPYYSRSVTVSGWDRAGNFGSDSSGSFLFSADPHPPTFSAEVLYPYVGTHVTQYLSITSDDFIPEVALLWIGDELAVLSGGGGYNFTFHYQPTAATPDGPKDGIAIGVDSYGNLGTTTFTALLTVDNTAPVTTVTVEDSSLVGGESFPLSWVSSDGAGSGVTSVTVFGRGPGEAAYGAVVEHSWDTTGTVLISPWAGPGRYEFYGVATDAVYNNEAVPAEPQAVVIVNTAEGSPFTVDVPAGDSEFVFPLSDDFDCTITLTGVTAPGTLSVSRVSPLPEGSEPSYFRNPSDLLREALIITGTGGLLTGDFIATLEWSFDPSLTPGSGIDRVYRFEGSLDSPTGIYTVSPIGGSGKLRVTGIDAFSTWYAGNSTAVPVAVSRFELD